MNAASLPPRWVPSLPYLNVTFEFGYVRPKGPEFKEVPTRNLILDMSELEYMRVYCSFGPQILDSVLLKRDKPFCREGR